MKKDVNKGYTGHGTNDCRYDVYADIDGAIKEIKPYTTADKRKFSVTDGLQWLSDSRTGSISLWNANWM